MDKLKEEILKVTNDNKILTQRQLLKLLRICNVRLSFENYNELYSFLEDNEISLTSNESNESNEKKYILGN